jgi:hypothetical protein
MRGRGITYFVKVKDKIQFADIPEELIQHFDKEMYGLQVGQLIVICIDTDTKEEAGISSIHNLGTRKVLPDERGGCGG